MRISTEQNILRNPLNELLGSRANVRLLRVLSHEVGGPLGAADAANRAGLTATGARKALTQLVQGGFVARIGGGKNGQYQLRADLPFLPALYALFSEEETRYDVFLSRLRDVLLSIPELRAAWVDRMPTRLGQPLEIIVVAEAKAIPWIREELRVWLLPLEQELDQVIETAIVTPADEPTMEEGALTLLAPVTPNLPNPTHSMPASNPDRQARILRLSRGISELVKADPSIIKRALRHVARVIREDAGTATADLMEWRQILEAYSTERVRELLVSTSSRATRLRRSSPFFAVLTSEERDVLMKKYEDEV